LLLSGYQDSNLGPSRPGRDALAMIVQESFDASLLDFSFQLDGQTPRGHGFNVDDIPRHSLSGIITLTGVVPMNSISQVTSAASVIGIKLSTVKNVHAEHLKQQWVQRNTPRQWRGILHVGVPGFRTWDPPARAGCANNARQNGLIINEKKASREHEAFLMSGYQDYLR
jgi:hypothetical protein